MAEVPAPYDSEDGTYRRYPSTLAPNHPGTIPFIEELYDEFLPNFSSRLFNVGCDETWDLGHGQSRILCEKSGQGRVYLDFLKRIHSLVSSRKRTMMFWGDIILLHPELINELPRDVIALNWGYEAAHPFERETRAFARAGVPFYVCPGTSTWMTLIGRHDNAFTNLKRAADAGRRHRAAGYLITDWGDGGHPQPLAVSYLPYLAGASLSWCAKTFEPSRLIAVLSRDVFCDSTRLAVRAALALGRAHRKLGHLEANATPLGTVIAAPLPETRELFCRNGLKHFAQISGRRIAATRRHIERELARLRKSAPRTASGRLLVRELDLAARMAIESCRIMQWQQARARGNQIQTHRLAREGVLALRKLERDYNACWPLRNKGTPRHSTPFLRWRAKAFQESLQ